MLGPIFPLWALLNGRNGMDQKRIDTAAQRIDKADGPKAAAAIATAAHSGLTKRMDQQVSCPQRIDKWDKEAAIDKAE